MTAEDYQALQMKYDSALEVIGKMQSELRQLRRMIFGRRSERFVADRTAPGQTEIDFGDDALLRTEDTGSSPTENGAGDGGRRISRGKQASEAPSFPGNPHARTRRRLDPSLPVEEEVIIPSGLPENAVEISRDVTELLEYTPGRLWIHRIIRPRYAVNGSVTSAPSPSWIPLPRTNAGPSLLAGLLVSKYIDHLPLNRQIGMLSRQGMTLSASTVGDWVHSCARLLEPLYRTLVSQVMQSDYLQVDETTIPVIDSGGRARRGYHWVVRSPGANALFFHYDNGSRAKEVAAGLFRDFRGTLQSDGYSVYDIFENRPGITTLGCWAHARRKFEQALDNDPSRASYALGIIQRMYDIERECRRRGLSPLQRYRMRQLKALPLTQALHRWLVENRSDRRASIDRAIGYTLAIYPRLCRYLDDGRYLIDNNMAENAVRPLALGRKNYLFCGSHSAARDSAMIYSLLGTCRICGHDPQQWLTDILCRINDCHTSQLHTLLPANWSLKTTTPD